MLKSFWLRIIGSKSSVFFYCLVAFIAGIFSGYFFAIPHFYVFCVLLVLMFIIVVLILNRKFFNSYFYISLFLISFTFGFWRYNLTLPDYADTSKIYHYSSSSVEFIGRIKSIDARLSNQKLTVESQLLQTPAGWQAVGGRVLISQPLYPEHIVGEKVEVRCYLER